MQLAVDVDACVGTGQCELICPDVFSVGVVVSLLTDHPDPSLHDSVREAAEACPTQAILIEESS